MSACNPHPASRREFGPDDPLAPDAPKFGEAWHAQVLAIADTLVGSGQISANAWAKALGAERDKDAENAAADTEKTYFTAALRALEKLLHRAELVRAADLAARRDDWERAYLRTPHGKPVVLSAPDR